MAYVLRRCIVKNAINQELELMNAARLVQSVILLIGTAMLCFDLRSADNKSDVTAVNAHIKELSDKGRELEKKIVEKLYAMKTTVDNYSNSEKEFRGFNGLGRIEVLQLKADRYAIEREARKILEGQIGEVLELVKQVEDIKAQLREDRKLLSLWQKIKELQTDVKDEKAIIQLNKENIEYYEVKNDATLKQISELPEVYGNSAAWRYLFDANKDKIKDAGDTIKKGTVLVVPNLKVENEFGDL